MKVVASGGVAWRPAEELYGNIYDHMSSDFVYPNGVHYVSHCRQYPQGVYRIVNDLIIGSKGKTTCSDMGEKSEVNSQVQEHINMVKSILGQGPYVNQGVDVAESTLTCIIPSSSRMRVSVRAQISKSRCQSMELRASRDTSNPNTIPARPIPASLTSR